jgi:hypothetical protein
VTTKDLIAPKWYSEAHLHLGMQVKNMQIPGPLSDQLNQFFGGGFLIIS